MRFNQLFLAIGLLLSTSAKANEKLIEEDANFWGKFEKDYVDSFEVTSPPTVPQTSSPPLHPTISPIAPSKVPTDIHTIPPIGPPSMIPSPIPSSVPSFTKPIINPSASYYFASTMPLGDSTTVTSETTLFVPQWSGLESAPKDVVCFVGSATALEQDIKSFNAGGGTDCTAANGCGVHVHAGFDCSDKETQGGHWYNPEEQAVDPWGLVGYEQTDSVGYGQFASCVHTGFDLTSDPDQLEGHAFIVHAEDGSRISCGLISKAPADFAPVTYTADTVPIPGTNLTNAVTGTVAVMAKVQKTVTDGVCYMGYATGLEPDVKSFLLGTGTQTCNVTNGCGAHIHAGTGCENKDAQGGHYYDNTKIAEDPWKLESYYSTDSSGNGALIGCVLTGNAATDYESRPFIVHKTDGSRLLCGLLEGEDEDDSPTISPTATRELNASYYFASTMPLGDSTTVTSETTLFVPQWSGLESAPKDVVCFVGSATALEQDIKSFNAGGGTDCTAANGCGVHVHAGFDCSDKETQGGHWYNPEEQAVDPWGLVGYEQTDSVGYGQFASCVHTGFDLTSDPDQLEGHAFIVHAEDGSRVSCGLISKAPADFAPVTYTADTVPIPGTNLTNAVTGTVAIMANVQETVTDGVCYMGYATGLEPDVESFLLGTGTQTCNVTNGCGAHIHAGTGCENKDAQGGHYYDNTEIAEDPWKLESYYSTDSSGDGALIGCVLTGNAATDYESRPFIVHKTDGSRLLCGLLEGEDDTSPTYGPTYYYSSATYSPTASESR